MHPYSSFKDDLHAIEHSSSEDDLNAIDPIEILQIDLTADQSLCQKVWTSYGIIKECATFLTDQELLELQLVNKFGYSVAIPRAARMTVQVKDKTVFVHFPPQQHHG